MRSPRVVSSLLAALALFDLLLVGWAFGFPDLWFTLFHTDLQGSAGAELFLMRCGAAWGAFALFQGLAWLNWQRQPFWLVLIAGVRFSDIFTDPVYTLFAPDPSWFALLTLPLMGLGNFALGWYFLTTYLRGLPGEDGE